MTLFIASDATALSPNILIIIYEKDMFDYRHGEPPESYLTVLRALEVYRFRFYPYSLADLRFQMIDIRPVCFAYLNQSITHRTTAVGAAA